MDSWFFWSGEINYDLAKWFTERDFWSALGCDCWNAKLSCSVHTGGCAREQQCPVPPVSHSAEGSTSEKIRSQCFNMVV